MKTPWPNFTAKELSCKGSCPNCTTSWRNMDKRLMWALQSIRDEMEVPLTVSSAYRCPEYNDKVSSTGRNGPHTTGKAIDIVISGKEALVLVGLALEKGITGIGVSQKGPVEKRFIHLDTVEATPQRPRPWIWSY